MGVYIKPGANLLMSEVTRGSAVYTPQLVSGNRRSWAMKYFLNHIYIIKYLIYM